MENAASVDTVTVLFTDLVGSTELMGSLGDEAFGAVRRSHYERVAAAVTEAGGVVVKNTGDGMMAVFTSAADAVRAAVAAQQATAREARRRNLPVQMKVGIALGDASREGDDWFGTPVVQAARLCEAAGAGEVLATQVVQVVAGSRAGADFTDAGTRVLKGLTEPLPTVAISWSAGDENDAPLPPLLSFEGRFRFVARDAEREALHRLWKEASATGLRVALIAGEPGVGKTRLASELAAEVHADGAIVLAGRCDDGLGVPYQPFVEALRHYVTHAAPNAADLGDLPGELARLVPELPERVAGLPAPLDADAETETYRLFDAAASWLVAASSTGAAVLLVLDDVHWATRPTLLMLRHFVRAAAPARALVVATYRDTDLDRTHPLAEILPDLRREPTVERIALEGLDLEGVETFMARAGDQELEEQGKELARAIHAETEGNPLFVQEVLLHLAESGALVQRDGRWTSDRTVAEYGIPEGVRDVVGRRLSRLSEAANDVLRVASVVGQEFELAVIESVTATDVDELLAAVEEGVRAGLLQEVPSARPRYRFSHALVRAALEDELSAARRSRLHRKIGEAIERLHATNLDDHLPVLAHHFAEAAAGGETSTAVGYCRRAGDQALSALAHAEAAGWYVRALELADLDEEVRDDQRRCDLLIALGDAQRRAGDANHRDTLIRAGKLARTLGAANALAGAALAGDRGLFSQAGVTDLERVELIEDALVAVGDTDAALRSRLLAVLSGELMFSSDIVRRHSSAEESLALAREIGDPEVLGRALRSVAFAFGTPEHLDRLAALAEEERQVAAELSDPALRYFLEGAPFYVEIVRGSLDALDGVIAHTSPIAEESRLPFLRFLSRALHGCRALWVGDLDEAERAAETLRRESEAAGTTDGIVWYNAQIGTVMLERDRLGEMRDLYDQILEFTPHFIGLRAGVAETIFHQGDTQEARLQLAIAVEQMIEQAPYADSTFSASVVSVIRAAVAFDDTAAAEAAYGMMLPWRGQVLGTVPLRVGISDIWLAEAATVLGRYHDTERHLAEAETLLERARSPLWSARANLAHARLLSKRRHQGDIERARSLLTTAIAEYEDRGWVRLLRETHEVLADG